MSRPSMQSPFPGMNPYLEQDDVWEDFHHNFLTWAQAALNSQLGETYFARSPPGMRRGRGNSSRQNDFIPHAAWNEAFFSKQRWLGQSRAKRALGLIRAIAAMPR